LQLDHKAIFGSRIKQLWRHSFGMMRIRKNECASAWPAWQGG
jgi:hypothetical protein